MINKSQHYHASRISGPKRFPRPIAMVDGSIVATNGHLIARFADGHAFELSESAPIARLDRKPSAKLDVRAPSALAIESGDNLEVLRPEQVTECLSAEHVMGTDCAAEIDLDALEPLARLLLKDKPDVPSAATIVAYRPGHGVELKAAWIDSQPHGCVYVVGRYFAEAIEALRAGGSTRATITALPDGDRIYLCAIDGATAEVVTMGCRPGWGAER